MSERICRGHKATYSENITYHGECSDVHARLAEVEAERARWERLSRTAYSEGRAHSNGVWKEEVAASEAREKAKDERIDALHTRLDRVYRLAAPLLQRPYGRDELDVVAHRLMDAAGTPSWLPGSTDSRSTPYPSQPVKVAEEKPCGGGRTFTRSDGTHGCAECCNGDRCDDRTHAERSKCKFCKGTGSIPPAVERPCEHRFIDDGGVCPECPPPVEKPSLAWPCVCGDPEDDSVIHRANGPCHPPAVEKPCENCEGGGAVKVGKFWADCPKCCPPAPAGAVREGRMAKHDEDCPCFGDEVEHAADCANCECRPASRKINGGKDAKR